MLTLECRCYSINKVLVKTFILIQFLVILTIIVSFDKIFLVKYHFFLLDLPNDLLPVLKFIVNQ